MGSLNWRACRCPGKVGTVLPKVGFLATVVAPTVTLHTWTSVPRVGSSTCVTLHLTLLRRKTPRPLRLMNRSVIQSPPLVMSGLGPRWSTNPLRLLRPRTLYLILHLLHYPGLLHQSGKILYGQGCHHQANVAAESILKLATSSLLIERQGVKTAEMLELLGIISY